MPCCSIARTTRYRFHQSGAPRPTLGVRYLAHAPTVSPALTVLDALKQIMSLHSRFALDPSRGRRRISSHTLSREKLYLSRDPLLDGFLSGTPGTARHLRRPLVSSSGARFSVAAPRLDPLFLRKGANLGARFRESASPARLATQARSSPNTRARGGRAACPVSYVACSTSPVPSSARAGSEPSSSAIGTSLPRPAPPPGAVSWEGTVTVPATVSASSLADPLWTRLSDRSFLDGARDAPTGTCRF